MWPDDDFDSLVNVLNKYQLFQLLDSKSNDTRVLSRLKFGKYFPLLKTFFQKISMVPPSYFSRHVQSIIDKKVSLKTVVENAEMEMQRYGTYKEILKLAGYSNKRVEDNIDKFGKEVLDSFEGAVTGVGGNEKGRVLEEY